MRFWNKKREKALFVTHKDPLASAECTVGGLVEVEGRLYVITRWRELPPVRLARGGSAREWEIWGRPLADDEVHEALSQAMERILGEDAGSENLADADQGTPQLKGPMRDATEEPPQPT